VLFFMIINTGSVRRTDERVEQLTAEAMLREEEVLDGRRNLVVLRNTLEELEIEKVVAQGRAVRILKELEIQAEELSEFDLTTLAQQEHIAKLKADLQSLEEDQRRLEGASHSQDEHGSALRSVVGEGDRQYLTGLKVGGARILVLVDSSASMLGETVVEVLRLRNMGDDRKRSSPKWRRAVSTVEWIASQIPPTSEFQILTYNVEAAPLLEDTAGEWIAASAPAKLDDAIKQLQEVVPGKGTSLHKAFDALRGLTPLPDTVFLLTDGLPTQRNRAPILSTVSAERREGHFLSAMKQLPGKIPMNVILFPMEGDPGASILYWQMAELSGGSLVSPSRDWP
jgi:hypothetical protein